MAEVLVFCSKTMNTTALGEVGVEDISLRHPSTHAVGYMNWQITFPVDLQAISNRRSRTELQEWYSIRFQSRDGISRSMLLRDLSLT